MNGGEVRKLLERALYVSRIKRHCWNYTVSIYRGVFESEHESLCVLELDDRMYGISSVPVKRLPEGETEILLIPDERTEQFF